LEKNKVHISTSSCKRDVTLKKLDFRTLTFRIIIW
jgi:hypothetical protein